MKFHEAANIFPLDEEHLGELEDDIRQHGQQVPIELLDGKILDGRRRYIACGNLGIQPKTTTKTREEVGHPHDRVVTLNVHRRHLTVGQLTLIANQCREIHEQEAKERMVQGGKEAGRGRKKGVKNSSHPISKGKSRDHVAAQFGISGFAVDQGRRVVRDGIPEIQDAIKQDKITLNKADAVARLPVDRQAAALEEAKQKGKSPAMKQANGDDSDERKGGTAFLQAYKAIDVLKRIPLKHPQRKDAFGVVRKWIANTLKQE
uniref:ParB/Sulfiredoxin domain-containing protein n=1 Tax=viral metagenome TaxID=1070528 RepID=A0A6M3KWX1_9ZZZZ